MEGEAIDEICEQWRGDSKTLGAGLTLHSLGTTRGVLTRANWEKSEVAGGRGHDPGTGTIAGLRPEAGPQGHCGI